MVISLVTGLSLVIVSLSAWV